MADQPSAPSAPPAPTAPLDPEDPPQYAASTSPPSYDSIPYNNEPPPSYESLYGRVRAAKESSDGHVSFFRQLVIIIVSTVGCTIAVAFVVAIPITMIVIGALFLHDCPVQHFIPIYLIVAGVFGTLRGLSSICQRAKNRMNEQDDENVKTNPMDGTIGLFLLIWFIVGSCWFRFAGNVWIYGTFRHFQSTDPNQGDYCNPTLYWFSFWITTVTYIILAFTCCCVCCAGCLASLV